MENSKTLRKYLKRLIPTHNKNSQQDKDFLNLMKGQHEEPRANEILKSKTRAFPIT